MVFLLPRCPNLNAIEEAWRQMKHAVLDAPYVWLSSMCNENVRQLKTSLPILDIEKYIYGKS